MPPPDDLGAAEAYAATRRWTDALRVLAPLLASNPDHVDALNLASHCHLALGRPELALVAAESAIVLAPGSYWPFMQRSAALRALRRYREACESSDQAVRVAPYRVEPYLERAAVDAAANKATKGGWAAAQQAVRLAPNDPAAHIAIGHLHEVRRRRLKAARSYEEALRLDPANRAAKDNLARLKQRAGRNAQAVRLMIGLVRLDPANRRYVNDLRAMLLYSLLFAVLFSIVPTLFATGSGRGPQPSASAVALVLTVCLVMQGAALLWLRRVGGPAAFRFLFGGGLGGDRGTRLLVASAVAIGLADLMLPAGVFARQLGSALPGTAMILFVVALFCVIGTVARRRT